MIRTHLIKALAAAAVISALALAQTSNPKPPKIKNKKELEAWQTFLGTQDPDARIAAGKDFITKFADTELKAFVLSGIAEAYMAKGDSTNMMVYSEKVLEADPQYFGAMILIANATANRVGEHDLDREENLAKAEKYAKNALELIPTATKPNPQIPDEEWAKVKKGFEGEAHQPLGLVNMKRKKYPEAAAEFKLAIEMSDKPSMPLTAMYGSALFNSGKYDEAIVVYDKVLQAPESSPALKKRVLDEKIKANQAKQGAAAKQ